MNSEIIPAILPRSVSDLKTKIGELPEEIRLFHFDVLEDDVWMDNIEKDFEVHLMVKDPEEIAQKWIDRGAKRIIAHKVLPKSHGIEIGLGVEMNVAVKEVFDSIENVDFVQLMSIREIGEQGHPFEEEIFDRIKEVREKFPDVVISVDGGINVGNYKKLEEAGVSRLIVGSGFKDLWASIKTK